MKGRSIFETALTLTLVLLAFTVLLAACENSLIYYPDPYPEGEYANVPLPVEDVWFEASDGVKLHGWYVPGDNARATLLWFHGNAGNVSHRLENMILLQPLRLNIFIFDYRGYGRSEGKPGEAGLRLDSHAAYDTLQSRYPVPPERLFLFGRSLGAFFAADVAMDRPAAGLIMESAFTSAKDMAKRMFPLLPVGWVISSRLDAVSKVPHLTLPKLFLHGTQDHTVPYELGRALFEAAAEPKEFYAIEGADHNDTYRTGGKAYFQALDRFITRTLDTGIEPDRSRP